SVTPPRPPTSTLLPYTTLFRSSTANPRCWPRSRMAAMPAGMESWRKAAVFENTRTEKAAGADDVEGAPGAAGVTCPVGAAQVTRSEEHTSELQSLRHLVCRLLL